MIEKQCPVCGGKLHVFPKENNIVCVPCGFDGNEKLWQELIITRKALDEIKSDIDEMIAQSHDIGERFAEVVLCNLKNKIEQIKTALEQKD